MQRHCTGDVRFLLLHRSWTNSIYRNERLLLRSARFSAGLRTLYNISRIPFVSAGNAWNFQNFWRSNVNMQPGMQTSWCPINIYPHPANPTQPAMNLLIHSLLRLVRGCDLPNNGILIGHVGSQCMLGVVLPALFYSTPMLVTGQLEQLSVISVPAWSRKYFSGTEINQLSGDCDRNQI